MAAVGLHHDSATYPITKLGLSANVKVACINSPESVTIRGDSDGINCLLSTFQSEGTFARKLKTDGRAYHSHHMAAIASMYQSLLQESLALESGCPIAGPHNIQMHPPWCLRKFRPGQSAQQVIGSKA